MACQSCKERAELLWKARQAYNLGDMPEARRLLKEMFGTVIKDVDKLEKHVSAVIHGVLSNRTGRPP